MSDHRIDNVLASRYASVAMRGIWSPKARILFERDLWIAVMKAQRDFGLSISAEAIEKYESVKEDINLDSINERERALRHDVKARIEEFNALAGYEHIHKGMTSRDLTDNVEQMQTRRALLLTHDRYVAALRHVSDVAERWKDMPVAARTHNVAAQPTTVGRRFAMFGQEMLIAFRRLEDLITRFSLRGIVGAVGTALDQMTLFDGDEEKAAQLNERVMAHLGFGHSLIAVGQVYPRSLDFEAISALYQLGAGPSSFCRTLRLMAGHELAGEGFKAGQVGSSAMPHKMNSRSCERVNGFLAILKGYMTMAATLSGDQWNEGDVSCSVVRRVALPDSFFAIDGMLELFMTILNEMGVNEPVVEQELNRYLPFLATTTILMQAVKAGAGREEAHEAIKKHAVAVAKAMREEGLRENDLAERLGNDNTIPLSLDTINQLLNNRERFLGAAMNQVEEFNGEVADISEAHPAAAKYEPGDVL